MVAALIKTLNADINEIGSYIIRVWWDISAGQSVQQALGLALPLLTFPRTRLRFDQGGQRKNLSKTRLQHELDFLDQQCRCFRLHLNPKNQPLVYQNLLNNFAKLLAAHLNEDDASHANEPPVPP